MLKNFSCLSQKLKDAPICRGKYFKLGIPFIIKSHSWNNNSTLEMISPHYFALRIEFFSFFLGKLHWLKVRSRLTFSFKRMQGDINQPVKKRSLIFVSEIINCIQTPEIRFTILCESIIDEIHCTMNFSYDFLFTFSQFKKICLFSQICVV